MPSVLMTGATGQLGSTLRGPVHAWRDVVGAGHATHRPGDRQCDLTDADATRAMLEEVRPSVILHLAALANVDLCEKEPDRAYRLNVRATQTLVDWCLEQAPDVYFVYISTDQVYDAPGPSTEDQAQPKNVYALTKLWAEDHAKRLARHCILRVNFFSDGYATDKGLVSWLASSAVRASPVRLFSDVLFNPLHVADLSVLIVEMMKRDGVGTYNLGAGGEGLSKSAFLREAARHLGISDANFEDGSVADAPLAAYRPRDMRMDVSRAEEMFGRKMPTVAAGLNRLKSEQIRSQAK